VAECKKMIELVSAYVDGECSAEEAAELKEHLDECASCRALLAIYESISKDLFDAAAEPPAALKDGVMEKIRKEPIPFPGHHTGVKTKRFNWLVFIKITAAAACIALVIYAAPQFLRVGKNSETIEMSTRMDTAPSASVAAAPNMEIQDTQASESAQTDDAGAKLEGNGTPAPAEAPPAAPAPSEGEGTSSDPSESATGHSEVVATGSAAPVPPPSASDNGTMYTMQAGGSKSQGEAYYATITITGELPEVLAEYDRIDAEDGTVHIVIPAEVAKVLIADHYTADVINVDAAEALVIYSEN
jgi:negative regulator of sigma E activity